MFDNHPLIGWFFYGQAMISNVAESAWAGGIRNYRLIEGERISTQGTDSIAGTLQTHLHGAVS